MMTTRILALALPFLVACVPAALAANEEDFTIACKSQDGFLEIWSDHGVDASRCAETIRRARKAFAFVTRSAGWVDTASLTAKPLQFALVGDDEIGVLGYAQGPDLMVMKDSYLDDPLSEGTLAHELTHIQDLRQLRGKRLPSFMLEGRALTIGHAYRMHVGQSAGDYDRQMARSAVTFTATRAMELLDDYRGHGWDNQAIGTLVVQYLRAQWRGGIPNANQRLSAMIGHIAAGRGFEQAFEDVFGHSAESFADDFTAFLRATQATPKKRIEGTIWQSIGDEAPARAPQRRAPDSYVSDVLMGMAWELLP